MSPLCAWCRADSPSTELTADTEGTTPHLLCPACLEDLGRLHGMGILARVEELHHAAVVVDQELRIRAANGPACALLRADWVSLLGQQLCAVLGCRRAHGPDPRDPEGPTPRCAVHGLVIRTFQMGTVGATALPALCPTASGTPSSAAHLITALRAGEVVALRIERLADTA